MGGENKKATKKRVPASKLNSYWSFKHSHNMSKRAIKHFKRVLKLTKNAVLAAEQAKQCGEAHKAKGFPLVLTAVEKYIRERS